MGTITKESIRSSVILIISEILFIDEVLISQERLIDIDGMDSLALSLTFERIQSKFNIIFKSADIYDLDTIESIVLSVYSKL